MGLSGADLDIGNSREKVTFIESPHNQELNSNILSKNNERARKDFLNAIRKFDDRSKLLFSLNTVAISYYKAKNNLWGMTKDYLQSHFEKKTNSRKRVNPIYNKRGELVNTDIFDLSLHTEQSIQFT